VQVRQDWGIRESVGQDGWQGVMCQYLRQDRQEVAKLAAELAGMSAATPSGRRKSTQSSTECEHCCHISCMTHVELRTKSMPNIAHMCWHAVRHAQGKWCLHRWQKHSCICIHNTQRTILTVISAGPSWTNGLPRGQLSWQAQALPRP